MNLKKVSRNLYNINLKQDKPGFRNFISPYIYKSENFSFIVDPGPTSTINNLKTTLNELGINKKNLDYILITHIHIDHSGGVGELINSFPETQIICHPKGIKHLIDPKKLWNASKKTLGEIALMYGKISPVPSNLLKFSKCLSEGKIKAIETLGHASHHLAFIFKKYLFIGDAAGVCFPLNDIIYLRPATPPVFNYKIAADSLDILLKLDLEDFKICFAHHGVQSNAKKMLTIAKRQLDIWYNVIKSHLEKEKNLRNKQKLIKQLKTHDEYFGNIDFLPDDIKQQEIRFALNSVKGIIRYLKTKN